jgi:hypothetical protein
MRKITYWLGLLGLLLVLPGVTRANQLTWAVTSGVWSNYNATALLYSSNPATQGVSYLVQLVYAGADGVADPATEANATGVTVDDVVVGYTWIGFGVPNTLRMGHFNTAGTPYADTYTNGSDFFIRAWDGPSINGDGTIPPLATHYGDSALHVITDFTSGNPETFEAGGAQPTWYAIPEAGTCAGLAMAVLSLATYRRLRYLSK